MALFGNSSCVAFTWSGDGFFRGVRCQPWRDGFRVVQHWESQQRGLLVREGERKRPHSTSQSAAQILATGAQALGVTADTVVIVGGDPARACFTDVSMPRMAPADLRGALQFELGKHTPLNPDHVQWGYRILGRTADGLNSMVRVIYFRMDDWESWIEAASGLPTGVDMVMPAAGAIDPVLADQRVWLVLDKRGGAFVLEKNDDGRRQTLYCDASREFQKGEGFGGGAEPLAVPQLNPGPLAELPPQRQQRFASACILAMYGLTGQFARDRRQWLPVPLEMRPTRNQVQKVWTMAAVLYLIFILGFLASGRINANYLALRERRAETVRLQAEIKALQPDPEIESFGDALATEIRENQATKASITRTLAGLSEIADARMWVTSFTWDGGDCRFDLRVGPEHAEDAELTKAVMESALLQNPAQRVRRNPDGSVIYTIDCRAVVDPPPLEALRPPPKPEPEPVPEPPEPPPLPPDFDGEPEDPAATGIIDPRARRRGDPDPSVEEFEENDHEE